MKVTTEILENHYAKLLVELESGKLQEARTRAVRKLTKSVKIPGFRPGKAPYNVLVRHVGETEIMQAALDNLIDDVYPESIKEAGISPYGPGELVNILSNDPPTFEFRVPLSPEVSLGDYKSIRKEYLPTPILDKDVESSLLEIQESRAIIEPVERAAQEGDMIYVNLLGKEVENGEELINHDHLPVLLTTSTEDKETYPFPGFKNQLIGLEKDAQGTQEHTYDNEDALENLKGKTVLFEYSVKEVKSRELPALDDAFAQSLGEYENIDALVEDIRRELEGQRSEEYDSSYETSLIDEIVAISDINFPPQMVDDEIDGMLKNLKDRLQQQGITFDLYLKIRQETEDSIREGLRESAILRVKRGLVLVEVMKREEINVEQDRIVGEVREYINAITAKLSEKERRKVVTEAVVEEMVNSAISTEMSKKTMDRIKNIASGSLESIKIAEDEQVPEASTEAAAEEASEETVETLDENQTQ